ncbi:MAG: hypothetical protein OEY96_13375 [Gammaproteobacteria bacterium]|nr:hypothetical protein [Gammaproteobacteria bacterium]
MGVLLNKARIYRLKIVQLGLVTIMTSLSMNSTFAADEKKCSYEKAQEIAKKDDEIGEVYKLQQQGFKKQLDMIKEIREVIISETEVLESLQKALDTTRELKTSFEHLIISLNSLKVAYANAQGDWKRFYKACKAEGGDNDAYIELGISSQDALDFLVFRNYGLFAGDAEGDTEMLHFVLDAKEGAKLAEEELLNRIRQAKMRKTR